MPKLTYRAQTPDDPAFVRVEGIAFESGQSVDVPDHIAETLKGNPWFTSGKAATEQAAAMSAAGGLSPGPSSGIDSSVVPAYPPGSGMKYAPETVMTDQGLTPAADADTDETIGAYEIKHKGRGSYDVLSGGETVANGMTKAEAEEFVRARSV